MIEVTISDGQSRVSIGPVLDDGVRVLNVNTTDPVRGIGISLTNQNCVDLAAALISHLDGFTIAFIPGR